MSLPNEVIVDTSKLTAIGDAIRSRFGVSGDLTLDEMAETVMPSLPSQYQQVDYIENTSKSAIKTSIYPQSGDVLSVDFQANSVNGNVVIVGCSNASSGSTNRFLMGWSPNSDGNRLQAADKNWINSNVVADTDRHTLEFDSTGSLKLDGESIMSFTPSWGGLNYPIGIFSKYYGSFSSTEADYLHGKVYGVNLKRNNRLEMSLIPCYRKSDNEIGLYDLINGTFYTNQGGGSFTCYPAPPSN